MIRRFALDRLEDETGVSGTGVVAEGVEFSSGKCVLTWLTVYSSIAVYDNISDLEAVHGHNGKTVVRWQDEEKKDELIISITKPVINGSMQEAIRKLKEDLDDSRS
jgi:hypothetical protein